jgi:hypothetical protein
LRGWYARDVTEGTHFAQTFEDALRMQKLFDDVAEQE